MITDTAAQFRYSSHPNGVRTCALLWKGTAALTLALCLSSGVSAQRDDRPPSAYNDDPPAVTTRSAVPGTLSVPAGTILRATINDYLSSDRNHPNDSFTAALEQPLVVRGWVVARRGQVLRGRVRAAEKAGRVKGVSQLAIELTDVTLVDGQLVPIQTQLWTGSAGTSHGQDAATIGGTTALGTIIGAAANGGRGAAIGAGSGAAAGIAAVLLTRGRPTVLLPESEVSFELVNRIEIDTSQSQQAFLPVTQADYDGGRVHRRSDPVPVRYPYPVAYPCGYGCGWPVYRRSYWYPGYIAFYGGGFPHRGYWGHGRRW